MKNPLTPAGIEPVTFRFVAQHLNHCATAVTPLRLNTEYEFLDSRQRAVLQFGSLAGHYQVLILKKQLLLNGLLWGEFKVLRLSKHWAIFTQIKASHPIRLEYSTVLAPTVV